MSLDEIGALFEFHALFEAELIRRSVERIRPETRDAASRDAEACARETGSARRALVSFLQDQRVRP